MTTAVTPAELAAFTGLCVVLAATPGANLAVVLRCAASGGQRAAVGASLGLTVGKVLWAFASLVGLAALFATSAQAYQLLRLVGAGYLIWLGVQAIRHAGRGDAQSDTGPGTGARRWAVTGAGAFRRGLVGDLLNPKVGIFYTTVFPQFIGPGDAVVPAALLLLAVHATILMLWYPGVTYLLARVGRLVHRRVTAWAERTMGVALVLLGVRLAAEAR